MYNFYNFCVLKIVEIQYEICLIKLRNLLTSFLWPRWPSWKYNKGILGVCSTFPTTIWYIIFRSSKAVSESWNQIKDFWEKTLENSSWSYLEFLDDLRKVRHKVANFFRIYLSSRLITDWCIVSSQKKKKKQGKILNGKIL